MKKLGKKMNKAQYTVQQYSCTCSCPCFQQWATVLSTSGAWNLYH
ncbi:CLI_3235 family bacteriocin precursor [Paenibacillus kribbensis]